MSKYCINCGKKLNDKNDKFCARCGYSFELKVTPTKVPATKSKVAAGLLALFLGGFGVHNFYLGYYGKAVAQLLITLIVSPLTCFVLSWISPLWSLIEGIMLFCGSINVDADGNPLGE